MNTQPKKIFEEYNNGVTFKSSLGSKGLYEQSRINERFYTGDQWYGANCGNSRPLVRHNIIKRIGDFKMSQVASSPFSVRFGAEGIPNSISKSDLKKIKSDTISKGFKFDGRVEADEINTVMSALSSYREVTADRLKFDILCARALKNAYISGSGVIYTYWDGSINTGLYADDLSLTPVRGDIKSEVIGIEDVYFADPNLEDVQAQDYIIISSLKGVDDVKREASVYGADKHTLSLIEGSAIDGKVTVLTKLYKEYKINGECSIRCVKVTEKATVRPAFDTRLRMYPIAVFRWEERSNLAYGESEITHLIPNQIAINRMITANVWSAVTMGMPIMVVNGDTVTDNITNDPGQVIKVFGSNEDVKDAVNYVTPPDVCSDFGSSINTLIENTLNQSGANAVALGDSRPDNATALNAMQSAALLPLNLIKNRFYGFVEEISRIWADFWITQYSNRKIKIKDENEQWYMPFDASRYSDLYLTARVEVGSALPYSVNESISMLDTLYDKGIINKNQYLKRLPKGIVKDIQGLMSEQEGTNDDGV